MSIGIQAIQIYLPKTYVSQSELEKYNGISEGKYTKGLGQYQMSFAYPHEDVNSMSLTVVNNILKNNKIDPSQIGRLQVGTQSILDKSKSIKTILMTLFKGNHDIQGATSINACYGGTNALFNTLNWISSPSWDGRYGLVVAVDIAVYESGPARPTGGAGAIAILITKTSKIVINPIRASYMDNQYDFYKPILNSQYPIVDGKLSQQCYLKALKQCYLKLKEKLNSNNLLESNDYVMFHSPYSKMVEKAFASIAKLQNQNITSQETDLLFKKKVEESLYISKKTGNIYTGSLYSCLISLLFRQPNIKNKKILMFSYGSGLCSSIFQLTIKQNPLSTTQVQRIQTLFQKRIKIDPKVYTEVLLLRQRNLSKKGKININNEYIEQNTFYLDEIDEKYRRSYKFKSSNINNITKNDVSAMQRIQQIDKEITNPLDKFYKQNIGQRHQTIQNQLNIKINVSALQSGGINSQQADSMIENVIGKVSLPLGVLPSILINKKKYMIPMSIEQPSVIAASSSIAKFIAPFSFQTSSTPSIMIGQVYLSDVQPSQINSILKRKQVIIEQLNNNCLSMVQRNGGVKDIRIRQLYNEKDKHIRKYSMDILIDVCEAMGANIVNTLAQKTKQIISRMGIKAGISILSNYCIERKSVSQFIIPIQKMEWKGYSGEQVSKKILQAYNFAKQDVFRAVTHNKGIMNGIDAVCLATGQDWRAVESAAHAYAAKNGRYQPLTHYQIIKKQNNKYFKGIIQLPIAVGIVGGVLSRNQVYSNSLNILGNPSAQQLSQIIVTIGLAQNFAALRALAIEGIQKGHMRLHSRAIAMKYKVPSHLIEQCCRHMQSIKRYDQQSVKKFLEFYSKPKL